MIRSLIIPVLVFVASGLKVTAQCDPDVTPPTITCAADVTINTTPGLCTGTTTLTEPVVSDNCLVAGNALDFDGTNDHVVLSGSSNFNFTGSFTIEVWIKVSSFTKTWQAMITKGDDSWRVHRYGNSNNIAFGTNGLSNMDLQSNVNVNDGNWHHVAAVYDGSYKKIYIDGILDVSTSVTGSLDVSSYNVAIGENLQANGRHFHGKLDEIRIWTVARTQSQIQANMKLELAAQSGLLAVYHLNEGTAGGTNTGITTATDVSGNSYDGTLTNFALTGTTSNWVTGNAFSTITLTNNAPATYPIGNTTVTWTATDPSNNTATCDQVVTVNPLPAPDPVTATPALICPGASSDLNGTSSGNTIQWFTVPTGGTAIGSSASGADFSVSPASTTTYYAQANFVPDLTTVYNISESNLVNLSSDCGSGNLYNGCSSGNFGFQWTDTGSGSVSSIEVKFVTGVQCHTSPTTFTTSLNGLGAFDFTSNYSSCSCTPASFQNVTLNPSTTGYVVGGTNTFLITNPTTCMGLSKNQGLGAYYAKVTVVTQGTPCSSATRTPVTVTVNNNPPVITTSGSFTFCEPGSALLETGSYSSYQWKRNGNNIGTGSTYNATQSGSYTVTVVDGNGCTVTSAAQNVGDVVNPTFTTCPSNITESVSFAGSCWKPITFTTPVGTDNCAVQSLVQILGLPSGSQYPVGTMTNTFRATDTAGNTATCSFTVTVNPLP